MPRASTPSPEDDDLIELPEPPPVHYAEQALLGALLLDPRRRTTIGDLEPGHFANWAHGELFSAVRTVSLPDPDRHRTDASWLTTVLHAARPEAPGLTPSYLHTLIQVCPQPDHAPSYARMIRAEHARRTLRLHAGRLAATADDLTLPHRVTAVLEQADALDVFLNDLSGRFAPHSGPPAHPAQPVHLERELSRDTVDEERSLLAAATAHPAEAAGMRWLLGEDFASARHAALWDSVTALARRGEPVDPLTVLWEAQQRGVLEGVAPAGLLDRLGAPVGSPEYWGKKIVQRALLHRAHEVAARIARLTEAPRPPQQLIAASRRALADLTAVRARWQHATRPPERTAPTTRRSASVPRAGPPAARPAAARTTR